MLDLQPLHLPSCVLLNLPPAADVSVCACAVLPKSREQVGDDCRTAVFVCQQDHVEIVLTAVGALWYLVYIVWFIRYLLQEFRFLQRSALLSLSGIQQSYRHARSQCLCFLSVILLNACQSGSDPCLGVCRYLFAFHAATHMILRFISTFQHYMKIAVLGQHAAIVIAPFLRYAWQQVSASLGIAAAQHNLLDG